MGALQLPQTIPVGDRALEIRHDENSHLRRHMNALEMVYRRRRIAGDWHPIPQDHSDLAF